MSAKQICSVFSEIKSLLPAGKAKEEQQLIELSLSLIAGALVNLDSIARSLELLAAKHGAEPAVDVGQEELPLGK